MSPYIVRLAFRAVLLCAAGRSSAAQITVTSDADSGVGSLRAAFDTALGQAGADEIVFAVSLNGRTITLLSGEIATGGQQVTVNAGGLANGITVSGNSTSRHFSVPLNGSLELRGLTLVNGKSIGEAGGSILSSGALTLSRCTLAANSTTSEGGAIQSAGTCVAEQCTFTGNSASGGGALYNVGDCTLTLCTISGNTAVWGGGMIHAMGSATITNSIVAGNTVTTTGADLYNQASLTRAGANIIPDMVNVGTDAGPAAITAPARLFPYGNYGGPVPTMPPRADSPALDRVASTAITTDQRGFPRVMWGATDIGAVEAGTQADCSWEVREFFRSPATPLNSLSDALALIADPAAIVRVSAPPVINHHDPDNSGGIGYFDGDEPVGVDDRTPGGASNGDDDDFATVARTFISITEEDDYTFGFSSSEGAQLRIFGAIFTSSTRLNGANPANPAHNGNTLTFPGLTDNSATLGVCHLEPGVYPVEFITWERNGNAYYEVFTARGEHTAVDAAFRLIGDLKSGGAYTAGVLTMQQLPQMWTQEFEDGDGGFTVADVNGPFEGPWQHDESNGSWGTAGQGAEAIAAPSTRLTGPPVTMHCQGDAVLQFTHRFSFEVDDGNWDGGQVLFSVNDGPFTLVPPAAFTLNGYTGTVAVNSLADIRGQPAFVFDSPGYVVPVFTTSTARLGTFNAGDTLRVQFLASYDRNASRGNPAWEIDTVSIEQQCSGANPGWELTTLRNVDSMSSALTQLFNHWSGITQTNAVRSFAATINLYDPQAGGGGHGQAQSPFPGDGQGDDDQFAVGARAVLNVPATDDYTFCVLADDSARLRIPGSQSWTVSSATPGRTLVDGFETAGADDVFGQVRLAAGAHRIELITYEATGGAYAGLWAARGRHRAFNPEIFALVGGPGMIRPVAPSALTRQEGLLRPANDDFAAASAASSRTVLCTTGAGRETGEPGTASGTVWWRVVGGPGTLVFDTAGSNFDTVLAVYAGSSLSQLTPLASNDNYDGSASARVTVALPSSMEIFVQAGGAGAATGLLALSIDQPAAPSNDAFATPLALGSAYSAAATGDNDAATAEAGEPPHAGGAAARSSVWFTWTAPADGEYMVDTRGSRYDTLLAVYTGTTPGGLNRIASNDDLGAAEKQSSVSFSAAAGTVYRIAVDGRDAAARGVWRLNVTHRSVVLSTALLRGPLPNSPRTFRMTWQSEPWVTYRVERSGDLSAWSTILDGMPSRGSSTSLDIGSLPATTPHQYFRVRRE